MDIHTNANLRKQNDKMLFITFCFVSGTVILKFGRRPVSNNPDPFNQPHMCRRGQSGRSGGGGGGEIMISFGKEIN